MAATKEQITVSTSPVKLTEENVDQYQRTVVIVNVEGHPIRMWIDGSDPTSSEGLLVDEGAKLVFANRTQARNFRAIRDGADDATLNVQYLDTVAPGI